MITRAAIRMENGMVHTGKLGQRHHDLLNDKSRPFAFLRMGEQGFVDENNKFYNREDAAKHALEHGQIRAHQKRLFSEDLW